VESKTPAQVDFNVDRLPTNFDCRSSDPAKLSVDPANQLYWKWSVNRLDAEIVRDRILSTSGILGAKMFGPPINLKEDDVGQILVAGDESRRSIYVRVKRTQPVARR